MAEKRAKDRRGRGRRVVDRAESIHGARVVLPEGWADYSIVKRAAPPKEGARFRKNVVVTRHDLPPNIPAEDALTQIAGVAQRENPTYRPIARGAHVWLEQPAAYLDSTFFDAGAQMQVFQRQIALMPAKGRLVMLTLTCDDADLAALARDMAFVIEQPTLSKAAARAAQLAAKKAP